MVFSSILFVFVFLPFVLLLYYLSKDRFKNIILLISSLMFYAIGEPKAIFLMLGSIIINYFAALLIERKQSYSKWILAVDIFVNLGILYIYKYLDYSITVFNFFTKKSVSTFNILMPIGISFFTFQAISYVIDVYRKDEMAEKNILYVGLFISFFPQLVAGPIVRYSTIIEQIKSRTTNIEKFGQGAYRFILGFAKKIILANNLALVANASFDYFDLHELPVSLAWIGSIAFSLQIYFDFSGYSDMAIGLGKMFGFDFPENFNYPYISKSITEFWRRWHISLSQWFRDYVYIPLGGSRLGKGRQILNLFIVWILTGLWHGANATFVVWGLMYFVMLTVEKFIIKPEGRNLVIGFLYRIVTLLVVNFGWVLFNGESFHRAARYIKAMLGMYGNRIMNDYSIGVTYEYGAFLVAGIVFSTPICSRVMNIVEKSKFRKVSIIAVPLICIGMFIWAISFLILGVHNPFIYFNF